MAAASGNPTVGARVKGGTTVPLWAAIVIGAVPIVAQAVAAVINAFNDRARRAAERRLKEIDLEHGLASKDRDGLRAALEDVLKIGAEARDAVVSYEAEQDLKTLFEAATHLRGALARLALHLPADSDAEAAGEDLFAKCEAGQTAIETHQASGTQANRDAVDHAYADIANAYVAFAEGARRALADARPVPEENPTTPPGRPSTLAVDLAVVLVAAGIVAAMVLLTA